MPDDVLEEERLAATGLFHDAVRYFTQLEVRGNGVGDARQFSGCVESRNEFREGVQGHLVTGDGRRGTGESASSELVAA